MRLSKVFFCAILACSFNTKHYCYTQADLVEKIKEEKVDFIQLLFTDLFGQPKSCTFTQHVAESILKNGASFDGSSIPGYASITKNDLLLVPDANTFKILPWTKEKNKTAVMICDVCYADGTAHPGCTRSLLKKEEEKAKNIGYTFYTSPELEFFIFKKKKQPAKKHLTKPDYIKLPDEKGYCECTEDDPTYLVKQEILNILTEMGLEPEKFHHEVAPSQHEITTKYSPSLKTADNLTIVKKVIKQVANDHGLNVTFMAKPLFGQNGSGMHINYSLFDTQNNKNAFFDPEKTYLLSDLAKHFIAGNLKYVREFNALLNPTINSYKRLVKGYEAPVYICWGPKNRSVLIRIPENNQKDANATRAEIRSPDPMCNPYLAFAVILKSGLEGIINKEEPEAATTENIFALSDEELESKGIASLPASLEQAIEELRKSSFVKELLGSQLFSEFIRLKGKEIKEFNTTVTNWELERYL